MKSQRTVGHGNSIHPSLAADPDVKPAAKPHTNQHTAGVAMRHTKTRSLSSTSAERIVRRLKRDHVRGDFHKGGLPPPSQPHTRSHQQAPHAWGGASPRQFEFSHHPPQQSQMFGTSLDDLLLGSSYGVAVCGLVNNDGRDNAGEWIGHSADE
jgi:hypothetical protein